MRKLNLLRGGFTIVELIVAIVVIGLLSSIVLNSISGAQNRARIAKVESELALVDRAILAMSIDTAKWPNGCPVNTNSNPEVSVELANAGLATQPPIGVIDVGCEWTAYDVTQWRGPYLADEEIVDPWDNSYVFDPDYYPYQDCPSEITLAVTSVIASHGEDATKYTCDDIYREIGNQP